MPRMIIYQLIFQLTYWKHLIDLALTLARLTEKIYGKGGVSTEQF